MDDPFTFGKKLNIWPACLSSKYIKDFDEPLIVVGWSSNKTMYVTLLHGKRVIEKTIDMKRNVITKNNIIHKQKEPTKILLERYTSREEDKKTDRYYKQCSLKNSADHLIY